MIAIVVKTILSEVNRLSVRYFQYENDPLYSRTAQRNFFWFRNPPPPYYCNIHIKNDKLIKIVTTFTLPLKLLSPLFCCVAFFRKLEALFSFHVLLHILKTITQQPEALAQFEWLLEKIFTDIKDVLNFIDTKSSSIVLFIFSLKLCSVSVLCLQPKTRHLMTLNNFLIYWHSFLIFCFYLFICFCLYHNLSNSHWLNWGGGFA